jgi:hypothetical protein
MKVVVVSHAFSPLGMLITNQLAPVAIENFPAPIQALWFYNPYSIDIKLKLICYDDKLSLINDVIVVASHDHAALFVQFAPNYVGDYNVSNFH